jgi:hypothetical protein
MDDEDLRHSEIVGVVRTEDDIRAGVVGYVRERFICGGGCFRRDCRHGEMKLTLGTQGQAALKVAHGPEVRPECAQSMIHQVRCLFQAGPKRHVSSPQHSHTYPGHHSHYHFIFCQGSCPNMRMAFLSPPVSPLAPPLRHLLA